MINFLFIIFFLNLFFYIFQNKIIKTYGLYDLPDKKRKLHLKKTSVVGGLFFFTNIVFYSYYIFSKNYLIDYKIIFFNDLNIIYFSLITFSFFIFGYLDDKYNISANLKLVILILLVFFILIIDNNLLIKYLNLSFSDNIFLLGNYSFIFTLFCFIAFINAFNLFDGINCQIGFYILFILGIFFSSNFNLLFIYSLSLPLIIFLILNYSGKIFMGNSGTYLLGFILSYYFIKIYNNTSYIYSDEILLIMLLPGIDMIRLFYIRIKNRRNPFSPDRNHLHHKLLKKLGYSYTLIIIIGLSILPFLMSIVLKSFISVIIFLIIYFSFNKYLNS